MQGDEQREESKFAVVAARDAEAEAARQSSDHCCFWFCLDELQCTAQ